jgi:hypothetical protein
MHATFTPHGLQQPHANESVESRLSWLLAENEREADRRLLYRNAFEEEQRLLMQRPLPTEKAFALFGLLLGTLPPAAIFIKLFGGALTHSYLPPGWFLLLLVMNVVCCLVGRYLGSKLSRMVTAVERDSWILMVIESLIIGLIWALGTGAAGGLLAFGFGAMFGAACAIPVGLLAFGLFVPLHRLVARGGMIDARHFWPLACGVVMIITALILGL